jgi:stress-induced-phosphoprotein 1
MNRGEISDAELKERQAKSLADPEIQGILTDPIMRQVLSEMQDDPRSAQRHMAHPEVAKKIEKLVAAGIIQLR